MLPLGGTTLRVPDTVSIGYGLRKRWGASSSGMRPRNYVAVHNFTAIWLSLSLQRFKLSRLQSAKTFAQSFYAITAQANYA
jgi:hypothetical protein